jgi:hypothetical protein
MMRATFALSLQVPCNKPFSYSLADGSVTGDGTDEVLEEGNAVGQAVPGTSQLLLPGLLGVPLHVTAGPISAVANPYGGASPFSAIVSDSFEIPSLDDKNDRTLTLDYAYSFGLLAEKFTADPGETANARFRFFFTNYVTGNETDPVEGEVRLGPQDGPGVKSLSSPKPIQGSYMIDLPAGGSVDIGVTADVQGNAVWVAPAPEPPSAVLLVVALTVIAIASLGRALRAKSPRRMASRRRDWSLSVARLSVVAGGTLLFSPASSRAGYVDSTKDFIVAGVDKNADIYAGALAETWIGNFKLEHDLGVSRDGLVRFKYTSADQKTKSATLENKYGIPVTKVPGNVDTPLPAPKDSYAYAPPLARAVDKADEFNLAIAGVSVEVRQTDKASVKVFDEKNPKKPKDTKINNFVMTLIGAEADAGMPKEKGITAHSADAVAALSIYGTQTFKQIAGQDVRVYEALGKQKVVVTKASTREAQVLDPYFLSITDLTTGTTTTMPIMQEDITANDAGVIIDDTGIHLTIDLADPNSSVALAFTNEFPGVLNPYSYGATLSSAGFQAFGALSGGWTISDSGNAREAFFAFGPGGQPYDSVMVQPPSSLFTPGDVYTYAGGASDGVVDLMTASAPEPSTLMLAAVGLIITVGFYLLPSRRTLR